MVSIVGWVVGGIALCIGVWQFADPWTWTALTNPDLWLAKKAFHLAPVRLGPMSAPSPQDSYQRFMAIRRGLGVKDGDDVPAIDSAIHAEMQYRAPVWFLISRVRARLNLKD